MVPQPLAWMGAVVTLAIVPAGCSRNAENALPPDPAPLSGTRLVVPATGAYTGAYIDFGEAEDTVTLNAIENFEEAVGKRQAIVASSSYWGRQNFPRHNLDIISRHGAVPLVFWSPWDAPYEQDRGPDRFSLERILAGEWDAYIESWGRQARAFGRPLLVAWGIEMNGTWFPWSGYFYKAGERTPQGGFAGPERYKAAYRYVVDKVRATGADNIAWVYHVNNYSYPSDEWNEVRQYYPGDAYVDWIAMSAYGQQFSDSPWVTAPDTFLYPYGLLCALHPSKPILVAEWGVGEFPSTGNKAAWIRDSFEVMRTRLPRVKGAVFWHERWQNEDGTFSNLRATSSPQALEAYRQGVSNPFWLDRPVTR